MRKFNFLFLAVAIVLLNACKPNNPPASSQELVGRWNAVKVVMDGEEYTEAEYIQYIHFQFNADGTCVFNIEGYDDDDVEANYTYSDGVLILSHPEEEEVFYFNVVELTSTKLVIDFSPLEEDFIIHYQRAR